MISDMGLKRADQIKPDELPPFRLWLDDIADIQAAMSRLGTVKIEVDGYIADSVQDLAGLRPAPVRELKLSATDRSPLIYLTIGRRVAMILPFGSLTSEAKAVISDIRTIADQRRRPVVAVVGAPAWLALTTTMAALALALALPRTGHRTNVWSAVVICLGIAGLLGVYMFWWARLRRYVVVPRRRADAAGFWQRTKDQFVIGILIASVSVALGVAATLAVQAITKKK
jgi:hypothetical protein